MKILWMFVIVMVFSLCSCLDNHVRFAIQNISIKDSLQVVVNVNGKQIFNDYVKKAVTNASATIVRSPQIDKDANIEVRIPSLNLKENAISKVNNLKAVVITVRSVATSNLPKIEGDLTSIPKKEEILIAFFDNQSKLIGN